MVFQLFRRGLVACTILFSGLVPSAQAFGPAESPSKVILLGFDGGSFHLAEEFIATGRLPNCARLQENGTFAPLGSANPAESPVAWASLNTGMNPGNTNIFGFMRRLLPNGNPIPTIGYSRNSEAPLVTASAAPSSGQGGGGEEDGPLLAVWLGAGVAVLVLLGLVFGLKAKSGAAALFALAVGSFVVTVPCQRTAYAAPVWQEFVMPTHENDLRAKNFWDYLDSAGRESRVMQAACVYPANAGSNTKLLTGLSTPDVGGSPGTYFIYSNSDFEFDRSTGSGGRMIKFRIKDDATGEFKTRLEGPKQFVVEQEKLLEIEALKKEAAAETDPAAKKKLDQKINAMNYKFNAWRKEEGTVSLDVVGFVNQKERTIRFQVQGHDVTVKEGEWSDYLPVTFEIEGAFPVKATCRFHISQCNDSEDSVDEVRFFVPAVTVAADSQPPNMPITSPPSYGEELVEGAGYFDTIGWSCQTHAFKDRELDAQSFMSEIWETLQWRRKMLASQLNTGFDVLFQVFGTVDRVCHMMYKYYDPGHPMYDEAEANAMIRFGGKEIACKDAIPAIYEEMDKTIGVVLDKMDAGELGEDVTLLIASDHGFSPFREEVELNAWLIEEGFMTLKKDQSGSKTKLKDLLMYVDWDKTKAYSMSLGSIYLNLKGREANGIVDPSDYDKVCQEIIDAARNYENPNPESSNDPQVFVDAWPRSEFLAGKYADEIRNEDGDVVEGPADIQVGLNYGYRVAWGTAMGNRETKRGVVFDNKSPWSGDHTTVHPYLVRGIFFSNRKLASDWDPHLQDIAPTVLALQGVEVPTHMDGFVIPLAGLEEQAAAHQGNDVNRSSVKKPE